MPSKPSLTKHLKFNRKKKQEETDEFKPTPAQEPAKSTANKTPDILERYASRRMNLRRSPSPEPVDEGQSDPTFEKILGAGHHYAMGAGRHYVNGLDGGFGGWAGVEYGESNGYDDSGGCSNGDMSGECGGGDGGGGGGDGGGGGCGGGGGDGGGGCG